MNSSISFKTCQNDFYDFIYKFAVFIFYNNIYLFMDKKFQLSIYTLNLIIIQILYLNKIL